MKNQKISKYDLGDLVLVKREDNSKMVHEIKEIEITISKIGKSIRYGSQDGTLLNSFKESEIEGAVLIKKSKAGRPRDKIMGKQEPIPTRDLS